MNLKKIGIIILCSGIVGVGFGLGMKLYETIAYIQSTNSTEESVGSVLVSDLFSPETFTSIVTQAKPKEDLKKNYENAKSASSKTIGWIYVENTRINYPIMHGQNNYYLNRSPDGSPSASGSIFLDENCNAFGNVNIIHGHNMLSGKMFAGLMKYWQVETFKDDNKIFIYDGNTEREFHVISVFRTAPSISFKFQVPTPEATLEYAKELKAKSVYTAHEPSNKPLVILNTCFSDGTQDHLIVVGQEV